MWCPSCKADVAAEVTADNRRVRCATCGTDIPTPSANAGLPKTREARDLLERWASERHGELGGYRGEQAGRQASRTSLSSPVASSAVAPADSSQQRHSSGGINLEAPAATVNERLSGKNRPSDHSAGHASASSATHKAAAFQIYTNERPANDGDAAASSLRFDSPESLAGPAAAGGYHVQNGAGVRAGEWDRQAIGDRQATGVRGESARIHPLHNFPSASHFDLPSQLRDVDRPRVNWTTIAGQLLAYAGVGLLTVGSTLVLWSYFGGPSSSGYGPTGWLTTTAGQMLLFLGVVTLVSGGMEQTSEDVKTRIERLGERIIRIEQIARDQALRGPYIPADYFGSMPAASQLHSHVPRQPS